MISGDVHGPVSNMGNYNSGVIANTVNIGNLVQSNKSTQESLSQRYLENNWPRSPKAAYNANLGGTVTREACTPGTRVDILNRIYAWAEGRSSNTPSIFWLTGDAGSGKSTIAYSIARHFDGQEADARKGTPTRKILGANFFCSRQFEETRQRMNIIPTIVDQLARHSQPYANALLKANKFDSVSIMSRQMKDLLVDPWMQSVSEHAAELPPFLVVVDALDEIEDRGGSAFLEELLRMTYEFHLQGIKFLITSRPHVDLARLCSSFTSDAICALYDVPRDTVKADIATYLQEKLPQLWGTPVVDNLMHQADGLFIFAATAVRYVTPPPKMTKHEQIRLLGKLGIHAHGPTVSRNPNASPIDALYKQVMCTAFGGLDGDFLQDRLYVLHTLLCTQERVSTSVAAELQFGDLELVDLVIDELRAVLYVKEDRIFWYHASFPDFILSQARSGSIPLGIDSRVVDVHCEEAAHHGRLARSCFGIMKSHLRFNICNLPSSFLLDSEVPDLNYRIWANISESLRYSCLHWAQHLAQTSFDRRMDISDFLPLRVLFWIEAMNLLNSRALCTPALQQAREYILRGEGGRVSDLSRAVGEAANFATYFGGSPASKSTPHLYISSLATWSRDSPLSRSWKKQFSRVPAFEQTGDEGGLPLLTIPGEVAVNSVAVSKKGSRIVSGSHYRCVRVWNASTGAELRRLDGHSSEVYSVAFSSDDTRIVSGSWDKSVRVWDASTGAELRRLNGHSSLVHSVAFSSRDTHIVSGSWDKSVRVWDASTGRQLRTLNGHSDRVNSVAFSSDDTRIVSGSRDRSVRVWDASTGAELRRLYNYSAVYSVAISSGGTRIVSGLSDKSVVIRDALTGAWLRRLNGHSEFVSSVAFSSDDTRIVSGSADKSVRVWDASTGAELRRLSGHAGPVYSVAFSSNDTSIVSGSGDGSLRVWDALTGTKLRRRNCHSGRVNSVALSSDATRIVSGSGDESVRLWDASTGRELRRLNGHYKWVYSVAFSKDDTRIVSGSWDKSVRVWDALTGAELRRLDGHSGQVHSVAFSNNDTRIVSGSWDKSVRVWDASTGAELRILHGHSGKVFSVAFSSRDTRIVSGSRDKSVRVWDASTGRQLRTLNGHSGAVYSVAFSTNDTRIVSGSRDTFVVVWDASTGTQLRRLNGHSESVSSVAFSSDDTRIVSGSADKSVRVWDASTGAELRRLNGHSGSVYSVAFSRDDTRIVSSSWEPSVRVWDLVPHNLWKLSSHDGWILSLPHHQRLMWVPHDIQKILIPPSTLLNISSEPSARVKFADSRIGPSWAACYTPRTF